MNAGTHFIVATHPCQDSAALPAAIADASGRMLSCQGTFLTEPLVRLSVEKHTGL